MNLEVAMVKINTKEKKFTRVGIKCLMEQKSIISNINWNKESHNTFSKNFIKMIFLSHNSNDKPVVEQVALKLKNIYGQDKVLSLIHI